jgi:hypothetical protein
MVYVFGVKPTRMMARLKCMDVALEMHIHTPSNYQCTRRTLFFVAPIPSIVATAYNTFSSPYNCSLPCPPPRIAMPPCWDVEFGWPQDVEWETRPCFECGVDKFQT